jgi:hypothetical protein
MKMHQSVDAQKQCFAFGVSGACMSYALRNWNAKLMHEAMGSGVYVRPFCDHALRGASAQGSKPKWFWVSLTTCFTRREFRENAIAHATQFFEYCM